MDPFLLDFLFGAGIGFFEDGYIICPSCGCEFLEEEIRMDGDEYVCPACLRPLSEGGFE